MSDDLKYLDDEALLKLIEDVEKNDLVKAPDRIRVNVLSTINTREKKVREYKRCCWQVGLSVAAAAALLLITPFKIYKEQTAPVKETVPTKESVLESYSTASKEEVIEKYDREFDLEGIVKDIIKISEEDDNETYTY